ncbi:hypothetical protein B0A52_01192 [Exophiala mesophila]|uniref:CENP-V/GFA domain-containing protein n=1 Tax=Exophiala mesophila TaxID=212818 RepID=A0A438NGQ0_EXOME|nr:hypothetical protein B0A52_01192 [Exophiala mesophila]
MSRLRPLRGACNCGRNHYSIELPEDATEQAQVYFDDSSDSRRSQATPITAWLRIPLPWFSSSTQAHFPDETHHSIRKIFTPLHAPHCKRVFCGYCGTHISFWSEQPPSEADFLKVTLGSLLSEDLQALQDLDLLPEDLDDETLQPRSQISESGSVLPTVNEQLQTQTWKSGTTTGMSWFVEMIEGNRPGRAGVRQSTRRGHGVSADGSTSVEWEISEYTNDDVDDATLSASAGSKRKLAESAVSEGQDVNMKE